jgi:hypothetical protein
MNQFLLYKKQKEMAPFGQIFTHTKDMVIDKMKKSEVC